MYSKHCLPGMVEFFMNAEEPEEGANRLTTWAKRGMNYNWFIYAFWGIPHYLIWTTWVEGRLSAAPEDYLPSFEPHLYDVLPWRERFWWRILSIDAQMMLPLQMFD